MLKIEKERDFCTKKILVHFLHKICTKIVLKMSLVRHKNFAKNFSIKNFS